MAVSRYMNTPKLNLGAQLGTTACISKIRRAVSDGTLKTREIVLRGAERLDTIAGAAYGDGRYWWILAATSNVGWGLQAPPGTVIQIPELSDVLAIL